MDEDVRKEFWEDVTDQPSAAVIVERMVLRDSDVSGWIDSDPTDLINEIMRKAEQAGEASTADVPVYATCTLVFDDWKSTATRDALHMLAQIDDLRLYVEDHSAIYSETPWENRANPPGAQARRRDGCRAVIRWLRDARARRTKATSGAGADPRGRGARDRHRDTAHARVWERCDAVRVGGPSVPVLDRVRELPLG